MSDELIPVVGQVFVTPHADKAIEGEDLPITLVRKAESATTADILSLKNDILAVVGTLHRSIERAEQTVELRANRLHTHLKQIAEADKAKAVGFFGRIAAFFKGL